MFLFIYVSIYSFTFLFDGLVFGNLWLFNLLLSCHDGPFKKIVDLKFILLITLDWIASLLYIMHV